MPSELAITYEDEDGNIVKTVRFGSCPTTLLHGAPWVDLLIDAHDPWLTGEETGG